MNYEALANLSWNTFAVVAILWAIYGVYVPTLRAEFRHDLFALRRELFLLMAQGKIGRGDPGYARLRQLINGLLREAEILTGLTTIIMSIGYVRSGARRVAPAYEEGFSAASAPQSEAELKRIRQEINRAIKRHMLRLIPVSPSLLFVALLWVVVFVPAVIVAVIQGVREGFSEGWREGWREKRHAKSRKIAAPVVRGLTASALTQAAA